MRNNISVMLILQLAESFVLQFRILLKRYQCEICHCTDETQQARLRTATASIWRRLPRMLSLKIIFWTRLRVQLPRWNMISCCESNSRHLFVHIAIHLLWFIFFVSNCYGHIAHISRKILEFGWQLLGTFYHASISMFGSVRMVPSKTQNKTRHILTTSMCLWIVWEGRPTYDLYYNCWCSDLCLVTHWSGLTLAWVRFHWILFQSLIIPGFSVSARCPGGEHLRRVQHGQVDLQQLRLLPEQVHAQGLLRDVARLDPELLEQDQGGTEEGEELVGQAEAPEPVEATGIQPGHWGLQLSVWRRTTQEGPQLGPTQVSKQFW